MTVPAADRRVGLLRTRPSFFCSISAASFRAYVLALRFACLADRAALSALKEIKRNSDRGPRLKTCTHSYVKKVLRLKSARGYMDISIFASRVGSTFNPPRIDTYRTTRILVHFSPVSERILKQDFFLVRVLSLLFHAGTGGFSRAGLPLCSVFPINTWFRNATITSINIILL